MPAAFGIGQIVIGADRPRRTQPLFGGSVLKATPPPFAYEGLDRIFHERGRLAVCTCLVANRDGLTLHRTCRALRV